MIELLITRDNVQRILTLTQMGEYDQAQRFMVEWIKYIHSQMEKYEQAQARKETNVNQPTVS